MKEATAYSLMKGAGMNPAKAAAISKVFSVEDDTPEVRERLIKEIEKTGVSSDGAHLLIDLFLERRNANTH